MNTPSQTFAAALTDLPACDIININQGWLLCPHCRRKLVKLLPETSANNLVVFCRKCGHESIVNISPAPAP